MKLAGRGGRRRCCAYLCSAGGGRIWIPPTRAARCGCWQSAPAARIDPHINYTLQYWQLYQSIYDGLVTFKHAAGTDGFTIVPDLAEELPTPADDGKSYTFKIRKGIKFSNGKELTVKDVVASLQRIFKVSSPTAGGFYYGHRRRRQMPGRRRRPARSKAASSATRRPAPSPSI